MYIHTQNVAASTWFINHNMTRKVILDVNIYVDGRLTKVRPNTITHIDDNNCVVEFTTARAGVATVLGPYSGTNSGIAPPPPPPTLPLLRGFNTSDLTGSITLDATNTIVNGFNGATRSVVSRDSGKYQYRVYYSGTSSIVSFQTFDVGIATTAFPITGDPYSQLNGDKVTLKGISNGDFVVTGEFADSTLPGRFLTEVPYPNEYGTEEILDVLVNLDDEQVTFRITDGVDTFTHTEDIPPGKSWNVYVGSSGGVIEDLAFDYVGDTFTPDSGFEVWDLDDSLEAAPEPYLQPAVLYSGVNTTGLIRNVDSRPVANVRGNGSVKSIIPRGGSGKYQYRVFCEREFLTSTFANDRFMGIGSINCPDNANPLVALEGDCVVIGYTASEPVASRGMGYSFSNQTLPNRGGTMQMNSGVAYPRDVIIDFLADFDNDICTIIVREDNDEAFEVDGAILQQVSVPIPPNVPWHAYASFVNSTLPVTFDTAGYRFTPEPGYQPWDIPDGNNAPAFVPLSTLTPLIGLDTSFPSSLQTFRTNSDRVSVRGNGHLRSQVFHRGSGKYQYRVYNENGLTSTQGHYQYHGLGTLNSSTTVSNSYDVAQGDTISFGRPDIPNSYRVMHQFADSYGASTVQYPPMSTAFRFDHLLDVLLDLDNDEVTFRVRELDSANFNIDGAVVYSLTVPIPPNVDWYVFSFFPNATTDVAYDLAGYRFTPDPGYQPWDYQEPPAGFNPDDVAGSLSITNDYTISGAGGARSFVSRTGSGKYQYKVYFDPNSGSVPSNSFYGIATSTANIADRPFDTDAGDVAVFGNNGFTAGTMFSYYQFFESTGATNFTTVGSAYSGFTRAQELDVLVDLDNNQVTFRVLNGTVYEETINLPAGVEWFIYARSSNSTSPVVFDMTGNTFTPDPGYQTWED